MLACFLFIAVMILLYRNGCCVKTAIMHMTCNKCERCKQNECPTCEKPKP